MPTKTVSKRAGATKARPNGDDVADKIVRQAKKHEKAMVSFLRDLVAIPSESTEEKKVIERILHNMGLLFERTFVQQAVCNPSRQSF